MKSLNNFHIIPVHRELTKAINKLVVTDTTQVTKFQDDIYIIDNDFPEHIDNNDPSTEVYVLTLVNNGSYSIRQSGKARPLDQGYVVSFDGNVPHAMIGWKGTDGKQKRFAAIIWDVKKGTDLQQVYYEMAHRVLELEEFVVKGGKIK